MNEVTITYMGLDGESNFETLEAPEVGWNPEYEGYTRIWANDKDKYSTFCVPMNRVFSVHLEQEKEDN